MSRVIIHRRFRVICNILLLFVFIQFISCNPIKKFNEKKDAVKQRIDELKDEIDQSFQEIEDKLTEVSEMVPVVPPPATTTEESQAKIEEKLSEEPCLGNVFTANDVDFPIGAYGGNSAEIPDHTMPAFDSAYEIGADFISIDLNYSSDHKLISYATELLETKTSCMGMANSYPYSAIAECNVNSKNEKYLNEKIPLLEDVLLQYIRKDIGIMLVLKHSGLASYLNSVLESINTCPSTIYIQFQSVDVIKKFKSAIPENNPYKLTIDLFTINQGYDLTKEEDYVKILDTVKNDYQLDGVGLPYDQITQGFIDYAHGLGLTVGAQDSIATVSSDGVKKLIGFGVDYFLTTTPQVSIDARDAYLQSQSTLENQSSP